MVYQNGLSLRRAPYYHWLKSDGRHRSPPRARRRMLCLDQITLREIRLALKEPFRISSGVMSERRILLLELIDAGGATA